MIMTIHEIVDKCKSDRFFITAVIILVGISAFGLGRLSKINSERRGISIEAPSQTTGVADVKNKEVDGVFEAFNNKNRASVVSASQNSGQVVASKNGTKYYFPWCGGVKNISEKNLIYFPSIQKARLAGYTPAANCKGLE